MKGNIDGTNCCLVSYWVLSVAYSHTIGLLSRSVIPSL